MNSLGGRSGLSTWQRMCASSLAMVMMSRTCGILCRCTASAVSSAAAMAGSAAFFAPLICTAPSSGLPPWILNRSICPLRAILFCGAENSRLAAAPLRAPGARCRLIPAAIAAPAAALAPVFSITSASGQIVSRLPQGVFRRRRADSRRFLENPRAAAAQLLVCQRHVNHPILVNSAESHHRSGREHVQHHFLRRARLQARRARNRFGARLRGDRDLRLARQRRIRVRR